MSLLTVDETIYRFVKKHVFMHGLVPGIDDMRLEAHLKSTDDVIKHLRNLENMGKFIKDGHNWTYLRFACDPFSNEELEDMAQRFMLKEIDSEPMSIPYCLHKKAFNTFAEYCKQYDILGMKEYDRFNYDSNPCMYDSQMAACSIAPVAPKRREWPMNLYYAIWGANKLPDAIAKLEEAQATRELIASIEYVMTVSLNERETSIIRLRYQKRMTLDRIGDLLSLSRESIRHIELTVLRRLRDSPYLRRILAMGVAGCIRRTESTATEAEIKACVESRLQKLRMEDAKYWDRKFAKLSGCKIAEGLSPGQLVTSTSRDKPIEELVLSTRAYNALKKAQLNTVGEVIDYEKENGLQTIEKLGKKTYEEIIFQLSLETIEFSPTLEW